MWNIYNDNLGVIFEQWLKLHLSLDALSNQKIFQVYLKAVDDLVYTALVYLMLILVN